MTDLLIEDYAIVGDCETAALVGRNGSVDWLCWPNFPSAACFANLLGSEENGFWRIAPVEKSIKTSRRYQEGSLVLETTFETESGAIQIVDFMPPRDAHSSLIRIVKGLRGSVQVCGELAVRFGYGADVPWVVRTERGIRAVAGPDLVELHTAAPLRGEDLRTISEFQVSAGESVSFVLTYGTYGDFREEIPREPVNADEEYARTLKFWRDWIEKSAYDGAYRQAVERSLITLKALTFARTGGIVAAPTTSLPEEIGGVRNWDYRYCWLRDTTFTLLAFMNAGYYDEAIDWMQWLHRAIAGSPDQVQIMYGISGERRLTEWDLKSLSGYENSSPVRIGNAASEQLQLDIFGEVLDASFWVYRHLKVDISETFCVLRAMVEHLETIWQQPDEGIWEVRGAPQHFTYSKVMAWVAFDRAIKLTEEAKFDAPIDRWRRVRDQIHEEVCTKAFNRRLNSFVQAYDSDRLDASALLIPMVGFLPADDPRIRGTVSAIENHLMQDGLVMRYRTEETQDGVAGSEGKFLACSFWLVSNLNMIGRREEAIALFERLLSLTNGVGLLSEQYDSARKRMLGNFPQAFSHIAIIGTAFRLTQSEHVERQHANRGAVEPLGKT